MRVATAYSYESSVRELQRRQEAMGDAQARMTSGKRISKPGDDPTAAAQAERALIEETRGKGLLRTLDVSRNVMTLTESALGDGIDLAQRARETLVAAGNGGYSASERATLASTLKEIRAQLLSVANQQDGAGNLLFGRQGNTSAPFVDGGSGVSTAATGGGLAGSTAENLPLSINGPAVWLQVPSGNGVFETSAGTVATPNTGSAWITAGTVSDPAAVTGQSYSISFATDSAGTLTYSITDDSSGAPLADASGNTSFTFQPGKDITLIPGVSFAINGSPTAGTDTFHVQPSTNDLDVFEALDRAVATLSNPNASTGAVMQAVNKGVSDMDQVLGSFQSARAMVGESLNRLDGVESRTGGRILAAQTTRSDVEDVDMIQAISEFTNQQTTYQAALQSYAMVQKMSLFNYIGG